MFNFNLFKKPETHLTNAKAGIEKFVKMFESAAQAAEAELGKLSTKTMSTLDALDKSVEDAYTKYMKVEASAQTVAAAVTKTAADREAELTSIITQAKTAVDNHKMIYLNGVNLAETTKDN